MTLLEEPVNRTPMNSLRDLLPNDLLDRMREELGREEMLRLAWPLIVGSELGSSTQLRSIRQNTLLVAVPDRTWKKTLSSMEKMMLEAVHRFCGEEIARTIEFVEEPRMVTPRANTPQKRTVAPRPLAPPDLPDDCHLEAIADPELREMFRRSAQKYFAWQAPFLTAPRSAPSKPEGKSGTGQEDSAR